MTVLIHKKGIQAVSFAGGEPFALAEPRVLNALPLTTDEQGVFTLPRAQQSQPLRFEVDAWQGYELDYQELVDRGWPTPRVAFQAVRNGQPIGSVVVKEMTADPRNLFPVTLEIEVPIPLVDAVFSIEYDQWIERVENDVRSDPVEVHYDRQAPYQGSSFTLSGPSLIDATHLASNGGFARFTLPRWSDIRLEDQVDIYFRPVGGAMPAQPITTITISPANIVPETIALLIEQGRLVDGDFEVTARLRDRAGNLNLDGNRLDVQVDRGTGIVDLKSIQVADGFISPWGHINCAALDRTRVEPWPDPGVPKGLRFQVPLPQSGLQVGDPAQMSWQLCSDQWGRVPIASAELLPETPLRADGFLVMEQVQERIVDELLKLPSVPSVFDVSVRVGYRVRTTTGWRSAAEEVFWLSLQVAGGGLCAGRWKSSQFNVKANRSINMTQYENASGIRPTELAEEDQRKRDQEIQLSIQKKRNDVLQARSAKPSKLGKVIKSSGMGLMSSPLAENFTLVGALPNDTQVPARWPDNEVPLEALDAQNPNDYIYLEVPYWDDFGATPGSSDILTVILNGVPWRGGPTFRLAYPTPPGQQFPVQLEVTPEMLDSLPEGLNSIAYSVDNDSVGNADESLPQALYLDRVAPRNSDRTRPLNALQQPVNLPVPPIGSNPVFTREYLNANSTVRFPVPAFVTPRRFDQIELRDANSNATILGPVLLWPEDEAARHPDLEVPATVLEALGRGVHQFRYVLIDRAGNVGGPSEGFNFELQLQAVPSGLQAPLVAANIYRSHFNPPGTLLPVGIPLYTNALATDQIILTLNDGVNPPRQLPPHTFDPNQDPNDILIDWAFISTPDPRAVYQGTWSYVVRRDGVDYPSPPATSDVDLRVVGPVNPNDPDPMNPLLTLLEVSGGSLQSPINRITPNDSNLAGTIKFRLYPGAAATDFVSIYYGDTVTPVWEQALGAAASNPEIDIPLPWAAIQAQGNGVIDAFYVIRESATAQNFQQSLNTQVTVSAITVTMRNFVWYDAPNVPLAQQNQRRGATVTGVINCAASPWNFITLILRDFRAGDPGDDALLPAVSLRAGDVVTVYWEYHPGTLTGNSPTPPAVHRVLREETLPANFRPGDPFRYLINYSNDLYAQAINPPPSAADSIVCRFSVRRGTDVWLSRECLVRYNTRLAGNTLCRNWVANP